MTITHAIVSKIVTYKLLELVNQHPKYQKGLCRCDLRCLEGKVYCIIQICPMSSQVLGALSNSLSTPKGSEQDVYSK